MKAGGDVPKPGQAAKFYMFARGGCLFFFSKLSSNHSKGGNGISYIKHINHFLILLLFLILKLENNSHK